jgi:hypothetical protein
VFNHAFVERCKTSSSCPKTAKLSVPFFHIYIVTSFKKLNQALRFL